MRASALALVFVAAACAAVLPAFGAEPAEPVARFEARGSFDDVKDDLVAAIEGRGLVINNTSRIGEMLDRTGRDLGASRKVYERAEVLEFCSAVLSRRAMEADAKQIAFCPYTIAIYTQPEAAGKVFLAYRRMPADRPTLMEVDRLLEAIVKEATK